MPGTVTIGLSRGLMEIRDFSRDIGQVMFTFSFPALLLLMLGGIYDQHLGDGLNLSHVFAASIAASAIVSTSFVNLGGSIAAERDDGTLKRLRTTPMPKVSYFMGKIILVLVISVVELALMLGLAVLLYDMKLPTDAGHWLRLGWLFLLGVTCWSLLGMAASGLARSARSAAIIMSVIYTLLGFVSGVYIVPGSIPPVMADIGAVFPLKWLAQGFRSALLPDLAQAQEATGSWELGRVALVLLGWTVAGLVLCMMTFRWRSARTR
ncbi:transport permease protein [Actinorhabdospora filicis]|uniref:Transport permease protein n=1 Tax=Actinorhabdospora filicis TaxID=1785913 RepID=A0A9W6W982_9ACTN|nr:ABC transporter permease [Actinorhabdospora filicis]GLZ77241.1 transport permease protein [Actinorhabdospora filicis]